MSPGIFLVRVSANELKQQRDSSSNGIAPYTREIGASSPKDARGLVWWHHSGTELGRKEIPSGRKSR